MKLSPTQNLLHIIRDAVEQNTQLEIKSLALIATSSQRSIHLDFGLDERQVEIVKDLKKSLNPPSDQPASISKEVGEDRLLADANRTGHDFHDELGVSKLQPVSPNSEKSACLEATAKSTVSERESHKIQKRDQCGGSPASVAKRSRLCSKGAKSTEMQKDGPSFLDSTSSFEIVDVTQTVAVTDFYRQRLASLTLSCLKKTLRRWINVIFPDKRLSYKTNSDVESWWPVDEVQYRPRYLLDKNECVIVLISALRFRPNGDGKWTSALGEASSQFEIDVVDQFESLTFHEIYEVAIAEEGFVTGQDDCTRTVKVGCLAARKIPSSRKTRKTSSTHTKNKRAAHTKTQNINYSSDQRTESGPSEEIKDIAGPKVDEELVATATQPLPRSSEVTLSAPWRMYCNPSFYAGDTSVSSSSGASSVSSSFGLNSSVGEYSVPTLSDNGTTSMVTRETCVALTPTEESSRAAIHGLTGAVPPPLESNYAYITSEQAPPGLGSSVDNVPTSNAYYPVQARKAEASRAGNWYEHSSTHSHHAKHHITHNSPINLYDMSTHTPGQNEFQVGALNIPLFPTFPSTLQSGMAMDIAVRAATIPPVRWDVAPLQFTTHQSGSEADVGRY